MGNSTTIDLGKSTTIDLDVSTSHIIITIEITFIHNSYIHSGSIRAYMSLIKIEPKWGG